MPQSSPWPLPSPAGPREKRTSSPFLNQSPKMKRLFKNPVETLSRYIVEQGMAKEAPPFKALFASNTLDEFKIRHRLVGWSNDFDQGL